MPTTNRTIQALFDRYQLPEGCTHFGLRAVNPDLTSSRGFRWAFPGGWSRSDYAVDSGNVLGCPSRPGDGLCLATSWKGIRSGLIPAITLLVCAYNENDLLGTTSGEQKIRVRRAATVDLVWLKTLCAPGVDMAVILAIGVTLCDADLCRAILRGAILRGATLRGADLRGADLRDADLRRADLRRADLTDADLRGADLHDADLRDADLTDADLRDADLRRADLHDANLRGATCNAATIFPADFDPAAAGMRDGEKGC